jgi:hypothetical protein
VSAEPQQRLGFPAQQGAELRSKQSGHPRLDRSRLSQTFRDPAALDLEPGQLEIHRGYDVGLGILSDPLEEAGGAVEVTQAAGYSRLEVGQFHPHCRERGRRPRSVELASGQQPAPRLIAVA